MRTRQSKQDRFDRDLAVQIQQEEARDRRLKNDWEELRLAIKRGELIPKSITTELLAILADEIRGVLTNLQRDGEHEAVSLVKQRLLAAQAKISRRLKDLAIDSADKVVTEHK